MARVKGTRSYASDLRDRQAQATRLAVLDAAQELFVENGYSATTIEQIATRARVSKPTVFAAVGSKATLLQLVRDRAIAGDDDPIPIAEREHVQQIRDAPDLVRASRLLAHHLTEVARRYAAINEVIRTAADSNDELVRHLWATEEDQRLIGARRWIEVLVKKQRPASRLDKRAAADLLWLLMSPENYHRLVSRRGWTVPRFERWLADSIAALFDE